MEMQTSTFTDNSDVVTDKIKTTYSKLFQVESDTNRLLPLPQPTVTADREKENTVRHVTDLLSSLRPLLAFLTRSLKICSDERLLAFMSST